MVGFERSMPLVLVYEGGYVNHPRDPGGATFQGVTQRAYDGARTMNDLPHQDVRKMSAPERNAIYQHFYWDAVYGDVMPLGVDFVMFDGAVNSGPVNSIKWTQAALHSLGLYDGDIDGHIGPVTCGGMALCKNYDELVSRIVNRRLVYLRNLGTYMDFGRGWEKRCASVLKIGQAWATGNVGPEPVHYEGGNRKSLNDDHPAKVH